MRLYRVGFVGAGYVSGFHIAALQREPRVRIVGVTDLDQAPARAISPAAFPSLKAMAAEGIAIAHGDIAMLAGGPAAFAQATATFLRDATLRQRLERAMSAGLCSTGTIGVQSTNNWKKYSSKRSRNINKRRQAIWKDTSP